MGSSRHRGGPPLCRLDARRGCGDHSIAAALAGAAAGRPVPGRGPVLGLVTTARSRLLFQAATGRLADRLDDRAVRRQRICGSVVGPASPCCRRVVCLWHRRAALRPACRVLVGADLCEPARRVGLRLHHLDRCSAHVVLGGGALRICPSARRGRVGLVDRRRRGGGAGAAREICDGLLALVGARLCPRIFRRAPPFATAAGGHRHRSSDLFPEFLVELEQRVCQLPPHERQCRSERTAVPPGRLYRIFRLAIRRVRAIAVCRPDMADRNMARPCRTARPPARRLYPADLGE